MTGPRRVCPSCWRHNKAWSLYATCPFCGARGRPIPEVVGAGWPEAVRRMVLVTETDLCRSYRVGDARDRVPTLADIGMAPAPVRGPDHMGTTAEAIQEAGG